MLVTSASHSSASLEGKGGRGRECSPNGLSWRLGWGGISGVRAALRVPCAYISALRTGAAGALQNLSVTTVITEEECSLSHPGFEPRREFSHAACLCLLPSVGRTLPADRASLLSAFAHSPGESAEGTSQHPVSSLRFWENVVQERSGPCAGHFLLWLTLSWLVESSFEKKSGR